MNSNLFEGKICNSGLYILEEQTLKTKLFMQSVGNIRIIYFRISFIFNKNHEQINKELVINLTLLNG